MMKPARHNLLIARIVAAIAAVGALDMHPPSAAAEAMGDDATSARWEWSGTGNFPQEFNLTLYNVPGQDSVVAIEAWGPLTSVDGWGELQRSYQLLFGSLRPVGERKFIVLTGYPCAAEFSIAADEVLHLSWFAIADGAPRDSDLLAPPRADAMCDFPREMHPSGSAKAKSAAATP